MDKMEKPEEIELEYPKVSICIINSRGGEMFEQARMCAESQIYPGRFDLRVIDNFDRSKTIGTCWNAMAMSSDADYCLFIGDDDQIPEEYLQVLMTRLIMDSYKGNRKIVAATSFYTGFDPARSTYYKEDKFVTGLIERKFILEHPFDETLKSQVDSEYYDKEIGDMCTIVDYYHGYFYRQHDGQVSGRNVTKEKLEEIVEYSNNEFDIYIVDEFGSFTKDIVNHLSTKYKVLVHKEFNPLVAKKCKLMWIEWGYINAFRCNRYLDELTCKKIIRIHSFEVYNSEISKLYFNKYDKVIYCNKKIENIEKMIGTLFNKVYIPVGIDTDKLTIPEKKVVNNKIAVIGEVSRKKGIGELMLIAQEMPEYEFYLAGNIIEPDVYEYFNEKKSNNLHYCGYQHDLNKFFADKTYVINTSLREGNPISVMEGMSCGLAPLVRNWIGSEDHYQGFIWKNINDLKSLTKIVLDSNVYRNIILKDYSLKESLNKIEKLTGELI